MKKTDSPLYDRWIDMQQRCENPKVVAYPDYGGRGIQVCPRWLDDRIRRQGMSLEEALAKPTDRAKAFVVIDGEKMSHGEAARSVGMSPQTLTARLKAGMPLDEALSKPVGKTGGPMSNK